MSLRRLIAILLPLAATGCGPREMQVEPSSRDDTPATFTYGSLSPAEARFERAVDPRTGFDVRRMLAFGQDEFVIVATTALSGQYVFTRSDVRSHTERMITKKETATWGQSGTWRGQVPPVDWRRVELTDPVARCLAMSLSLKQHAEGGIFGSQEMVAALYCRSGEVPLPDEEIPSIIGALRTIP